MEALYEFMNRVGQALHGQKAYTAAIALIDGEGAQFPEVRRILAQMKIHAWAMLEDTSQTCQALQTALDNAVFVPKAAFDVKALPASILAHPDVQNLIELHQAGWNALLENTPPLYHTAIPDGVESPPLVVAFHGNGNTIAKERLWYEPVTTQGFGLFMTQSAQPWAEGSFVWGDLDNAVKQVKRDWNHVQSSLKFDARRIVTAGFSKGGEIAILSAMNGTIPAAGVIALGPGGPYLDEPSRFDVMLPAAKALNPALYIVRGSEDKAYASQTEATVTYLQQHGFRARLVIIEGLDHNFPADLAKFWGDAFAFIFEQN